MCTRLERTMLRLDKVNLNQDLYYVTTCYKIDTLLILSLLKEDDKNTRSFPLVGSLEFIVNIQIVQFTS